MLIAAALALTSPKLALFQPNDVVLFQGDSITDGNRGRNEDPNHILGHGYAFSVAARAGADHPNLGLTFLNRGISGNTLADLQGRWKTDALALKPTILSLLVGINDVDQALRNGTTLDLADFEARYDQLLAETRRELPKVRLVLGEPFTLPTGNPDAYAGRRKLTDAMHGVILRLSQKYGAAFVPFQQTFDEAAKRSPASHWIWDGIHPTYSGHQIMADAWERAYRLQFISPLEDPERNSAIAPVVNTERDSYDWLHRHRDILDAQRRIPAQVVLIGDSITHFWGGEPSSGQKNAPEVWDQTFGKTPVLNLGCGWDRTQNVLWRLQNGQLEGIQPKWMVLNIGTNNLVGDETARTNSAEEVAVGIRRVVDLLHERCPQANVLVMGVFPRGDEAGNPLDREIQRLNQIVAADLKGLPKTQFLDLRSELGKPEGGVRAGLFSDGTHPTAKGYEIWGTSLAKAGVVPRSGLD